MYKSFECKSVLKYKRPRIETIRATRRQHGFTSNGTHFYAFFAFIAFIALGAAAAAFFAPFFAMLLIAGGPEKVPWECKCHSRQASLNQTKHNKTCINCHMSMSSMAAILNTSKRNTLWTQHECDLNLWSDDHSIIVLNFTSQYHTWDRLHTECPHIICRICACVSLWNRSEGSHPHGIFRPWARCDRGLAKFQSRLRIGACVFFCWFCISNPWEHGFGESEWLKLSPGALKHRFLAPEGS